MLIPIRSSVTTGRGGNRRKGQPLSGHSVMESRPLCQANIAKPDLDTGELGYRPCGERLKPHGSGLPTWHCKHHGEMHVA